jgi:hypothetical protein
VKEEARLTVHPPETKRWQGQGVIPVELLERSEREDATRPRAPPSLSSAAWHGIKAAEA